MDHNRRLATIAILVCNAIIFSLLESFIPIPIPVPGVKLGLANVITLVAIVFLSFKDVLFIVAVRSFIVSILTRGVLTLAFSISGGLLSAVVMWVMHKKFSRFFSIRGTSIAGAVSHNIGQVLVASILLREAVIMYYLPVLFISALITGFITGSIGEMAIEVIEKKGVLINQHGCNGDEQV